jgi:hypothetical protein
VTASAGASENAFGINAGAGLEFTISPKKSYFNLEARLHTPRFKDNNTDAFASPANGGLGNLNGYLYTFTGSILFTW